MCFPYHRVMNRKNTLGKPDQRDLNENLAATHGLAHMIQECRKLFLVSMTLSLSGNTHTHTRFKKKANKTSISHAHQCYQNRVSNSLKLLVLSLCTRCVSLSYSAQVQRQMHGRLTCRRSRYSMSTHLLPKQQPKPPEFI